MRARPLVPSVANLRDLGGMVTTTGRMIAPRRLFRSCHFSELAPHDAAALAALGLRTVVDLRGAQERATAPSRGPQSDAEEVHLPIEPRALGALNEMRQAGRVDEAAVLEVMHAVYRRFVQEHTPIFAALLQRLLDAASYPLLFHCTAGKDRTGFAAVLVLLALRVPQEAIVDDYLVSNERWQSHGATRDWSLLSRARTEYLQTAFDMMIAGWGSTDAYLSQALGLDAAARERLGELLLIQEPA